MFVLYIWFHPKYIILIEYIYTLEANNKTNLDKFSCTTFIIPGTKLSHSYNENEWVLIKAGGVDRSMS